MQEIHMQEVKISPVGDQAVLCEFGTQISEEINDRVHALAAFLKKQNKKGIRELLPTYCSLLVYYDPQKISYQRVVKAIREFDMSAQENIQKKQKKILLVPCLYGGSYGPDLARMSEKLKLDEEEIVQIHQASDYKIYMLGFLPGFVYLGGLDERIHMPRLDVPRTKIPARSVGIGGNQTGVYPMDSPGGWQLIGSTPLDFYNPDREKPILCEAGEYIRFVSITEQEYQQIRRDVEANTYQPAYLT